VLETQSFRRVGSVRDQLANVRFVATTHHDLAVEVQSGRLRADLKFRLDGARLEVPPLRDRGPDVALLVQHFLERFGRRLRRPAPSVTPALLRGLEAYPWPGNVRELRNILERLMILSDGSAIDVAALPAELLSVSGDTAAAVEEALSLAQVELRHIRRVLAHCQGNKTRAAEVLGISRLTLRQRLKEAGVADDER
jgi:two-component system, NtrC family, response regulator AtoC